MVGDLKDIEGYFNFSIARETSNMRFLAELSDTHKSVHNKIGFGLKFYFLNS